MTKKPKTRVREVKGLAIYTPMKQGEDLFWVAVSNKFEAQAFIRQYELDDAYVLSVRIVPIVAPAKKGKR